MKICTRNVEIKVPYIVIPFWSLSNCRLNKISYVTLNIKMHL
jgi:hypothetical protein